MVWNIIRSRSNCGLAFGYGKKIVSDNLILRHTVFRKQLVELLAEGETVTANAVVPIPHAGVLLARTWKECRPEKLWLAFGATRYSNCMFREDNQQDRMLHAYEKVGVIKQKRKYQSVILIDEVIMSGTTMKTATPRF